MDRGLAVVMTALVGGAIALQAPINSVLGKAVGTLQAALVSFSLGTLVLATLVLFVKGGYGTLGGVRELAPWYLTGGVLGALYVATALVTVRSLGAGGVTAATIAGQLAISVVVDHFGWLGAEEDPISPGDVLGIVLLAAGTFLIVRE